MAPCGQPMSNNFKVNYKIRVKGIKKTVNMEYK